MRQRRPGRQEGGVRGDDAGSATAETAVVLPGVVLLVAALVACGTAVSAQLRCLDAARAGARAAARGDDAAAVREAALRTAPAGAAVAVGAGSGLVAVEVTADVTVLGATFAASGRAVAAAESGAAEADR